MNRTLTSYIIPDLKCVKLINYFEKNKKRIRFEAVAQPVCWNLNNTYTIYTLYMNKINSLI